MYSYLDYVQAFATYISKLSTDPKTFLYTAIPVTFSRGGKTLGTISITIDTGAAITSLDKSIADKLGINVTSGKGPTLAGTFNQSFRQYEHTLDLKIGSLDVVRNVPVRFADKITGINVIGWRGILEKIKIELIGGKKPPQIHYSDLAHAAMSNAQSHWRSRI